MNNPSYCTASDLRDVYPQIDEFDTKTAIYGWEATVATSSVKLYTSYNSGVVNQLFKDGSSLVGSKQTIGTASKATGTIGTTGTLALGSGEGSNFTDDMFIKIEDEIIEITGISTDTLTVVRGKFNTSVVAHSSKSVYIYLTIVTDLWVYDSTNDWVTFGGDDPSDFLMESGEDYASHQTDIIQKASSYFDSRVDANLPREQIKDANGEYDYLGIRTTALISCNFLVKAQNPLSEMVGIFEEEINFNLELINSGKSKLSYQVSGDSSKGFITEIVSPSTADANGGLYIVDTRGHYSGTYDRIKVVISTAGAIGTAKYDVYIKDSDNLKANKVVDAELINGDYQQCTGGLQIRFQGKNSSSVSVVNDEWEIEVFGQQETLDDNIGAVKYTSMTRTSRPFRKGYGYSL